MSEPVNNRGQSFDDVAGEVYREFANKMHQRVIDNPVCEVCGNAPSVRITRWGDIKAACHGCLDKEMDAFNKFCREEEELWKAEEEW